METSDVQDMSTVVVSDWPDEEEDTPIRGMSEARKANLWKKGQSGNPLGRPKGKTMKDYVRELMERMTDAERLKFLEGIPKEVIWRMAEGNPTEDRNIKVSVPTPILGGASQVPPALPTCSDDSKEIGRTIVEDTLL